MIRFDTQNLFIFKINLKIQYKFQLFNAFIDIPRNIIRPFEFLFNIKSLMVISKHVVFHQILIV